MVDADCALCMVTTLNVVSINKKYKFSYLHVKLTVTGNSTGFSKTYSNFAVEITATAKLSSLNVTSFDWKLLLPK